MIKPASRQWLYWCAARTIPGTIFIRSLLPRKGTGRCVILNEAAGKVKVMYSTHNINLDGTRSGDIIYRESSTSAISFGPPVTLMSGAGNYNLEYTTSAHQTYNPAVVVWATNESVSPLKAVGVLATDAISSGAIARSSATPASIEAEGNKGKVASFIRIRLQTARR